MLCCRKLQVECAGGWWQEGGGVRRRCCLSAPCLVGVWVTTRLPIQRRAQSAFFFTAGMVSMAWKRWCFSLASLMYDSSRREYISVGRQRASQGVGQGRVRGTAGAPRRPRAGRTGVDVLDSDLEAVEGARLGAWGTADR